MKITGIVRLITTPGRQEPWVTKKVSEDYFYAFEITSINDQTVTTCKSAFELLKTRFPSISVAGEEVKEMFQAASLPPGAADVLHITLGNFGDFRANRDVANDIDQAKVGKAKEISDQEKPFSFEIPDDSFGLVSTSEWSTELNTTIEITQTKNVGRDRDTILNLVLPKNIQDIFKELSQQVFGADFELWNAAKNAVPYHVTVAQANGINPKLITAHHSHVASSSAENSAKTPTSTM